MEKKRFNVYLSPQEILKFYCLYDDKYHKCLAESDNREKLENIANTLNELQPAEL